MIVNITTQRRRSKKNMYYAVYDVVENSIRSNIIQVLKDRGLVRIQKSVFCGSLSSQEKKDLIEMVKSVIKDNDSFYLILTCKQCFGKIQIIGQGFDMEYVTNERGSMVI